MCLICNQNPCHSLCPNNTQQEVIYCPVCGSQMGDVAYVAYNGEILGCESCVTIKNLYEN